MPFVVAKKGQGARRCPSPDHSDRSGCAGDPGGGGRARGALVEDFGGAEPTVGITLDGLQFTRLAGGRPLMAGRTAGSTTPVTPTAGARIIENLNYVI